MALTLISFTDQLKNYRSLSSKKKTDIQKPRSKRVLSQPVCARCHPAHIVYSVLLTQYLACYQLSTWRIATKCISPTSIIILILLFITILHTRLGIIYPRVVNNAFSFSRRATSYFRYYNLVVHVEEFTQIYYAIDS